ncbi:MAG: hypothetical protein JW751_20690 [Polyangiaceae bacterium]|nr:hypothetical protein [Polyangiaceae bacterium]
MNQLLVGVACEDDGHFSVVTRLVDETVLAAHDWLDGVLDDCRSWRDVHGNPGWYKYDPDDAQILRPIEIDGKRIARHGHIGGEPLKPEARMWRNVLLLFSRAEPRPEVVILARDLDGDQRRRAGLVQVRDGLPWPFRVVVAAAQPEVEAWRVAGFVPIDERERATLAEVRTDLSFDPTVQSHRLTSHPNDAATDAKRVLARLCGDDQDRRDLCLADRARLRGHGVENGLAAFLDEVDDHIVPQFRTGR